MKLSKYTTQVRYILEHDYTMKTGLAPECSPFEIISTVNFLDVVSAMNFSQPVYSLVYNGMDVEPMIQKGCDLVLLHYYTREIGLETVGLWKLKMQTRLTEIIPYYIEMYGSLMKKFDPFIDTDVTTTKVNDKLQTDTQTLDLLVKDEGTKTKVKNDTGSSNTASNYGDNLKEINKFSATPQDGLQPVEDGTYLTEARVVDNNNNGTSSANQSYTTNISDTDTIDMSNKKTGTNTNVIDNDETDTITIKGKTGANTYSKMIMEYRKSIVNINEMFIKEFKDLFMLIY